jgi:hypothetical protein
MKTQLPTDDQIGAAFEELHSGTSEQTPTIPDRLGFTVAGQFQPLTREDLMPLECAGSIDAYMNKLLAEEVDAGRIILHPDGRIVPGLALLDRDDFPSKTRQ